MFAVASGCRRCGVAHCRHGSNQNGATAFFLILAAIALVGGGVKATKAITTPRPAGITWSAVARAEIPGAYQGLYEAASRTCPALSPFLLAGIGKVESEHGQSNAPGVKSGLNRAGCCAGPMQFNLTNGRRGAKSTWEAFSGPEDSPYNPAHAIPAAARKLCANGLEPNSGNQTYPLKDGRKVKDPCPGVRGTAASHRALLRYNAACWYVADVIHHGLRYAHEGRGVT